MSAQLNLLSGPSLNEPKIYFLIQYIILSLGKMRWIRIRRLKNAEPFPLGYSFILPRDYFFYFEWILISVKNVWFKWVIRCIWKAYICFTCIVQNNEDLSSIFNPKSSCYAEDFIPEILESYIGWGMWCATSSKTFIQMVMIITDMSLNHSLKLLAKVSLSPWPLLEVMAYLTTGKTTNS